jgi:hypothetical protein
LTGSPWERALGARHGDLHPQLRDYFTAIPIGHVGRGSGVFSAVGTPRRWLWPVLALLARDGVAFPVWELDVPFTVENRLTALGTVRSRRTFRFPSGDQVMEDEIGVTQRGLVDRLGYRASVVTRLTATVEDSALHLTSTAVTLRLGPLRLPLGPLSPVVHLTETAHEDGGQRITLRIHAPVIGRIYEYSGTFRYAIEEQ